MCGDETVNGNRFEGLGKADFESAIFVVLLEKSDDVFEGSISGFDR